MPQLAGQPTFEFVTVNEARRHFAASVCASTCGFYGDGCYHPASNMEDHALLALWDWLFKRTLLELSFIFGSRVFNMQPDVLTKNKLNDAIMSFIPFPSFPILVLVRDLHYCVLWKDDGLCAALPGICAGCWRRNRRGAHHT